MTSLGLQPNLLQPNLHIDPENVFYFNGNIDYNFIQFPFAERNQNHDKYTQFLAPLTQNHLYDRHICHPIGTLGNASNFFNLEDWLHRSKNGDFSLNKNCDTTVPIT